MEFCTDRNLFNTLTERSPWCFLSCSNFIVIFSKYRLVFVQFPVYLQELYSLQIFFLKISSHLCHHTTCHWTFLSTSHHIPLSDVSGILFSAPGSRHSWAVATITYRGYTIAQDHLSVMVYPEWCWLNPRLPGLDRFWVGGTLTFIPCSWLAAAVCSGYTI